MADKNTNDNATERYKVLVAKLIKTDFPSQTEDLSRYKNPIYRHAQIRNKIVNGCLEIFSTYDSMCDIRVYINRFPYKGTRISKSRYLIYHIENYFNEIYIFKKRMISYLNVIKKIYSKSIYSEEVNHKITQLFKDINEQFKIMVSIRGEHVHVKRFADSQLAMLSGLEVLFEVGDGHRLRTYYDIEYKRLRRVWAKIIEMLNMLFSMFLQAYFGAILEAIANEEGEFIYP